MRTFYYIGIAMNGVVAVLVAPAKGVLPMLFNLLQKDDPQARVVVTVRATATSSHVQTYFATAAEAARYREWLAAVLPNCSTEVSLIKRLD
jgi:hypothetical protein